MVFMDGVSLNNYNKKIPVTAGIAVMDGEGNTWWM